MRNYRLALATITKTAEKATISCKNAASHFELLEIKLIIKLGSEYLTLCLIQ